MTLDCTLPVIAIDIVALPAILPIAIMLPSKLHLPLLIAAMVPARKLSKQCHF